MGLRFSETHFFRKAVMLQHAFSKKAAKLFPVMLRFFRSMTSFI